MADQALARDAETVLGYSATGLYAFWLYSLGPVVALLHDDLRLSYAVTSLHSTLWAAGTVLTGITFGRLAQRSGRWRLTWIAALGASAAAALLASGNTLALTLLAAGVLGYFGTILQTAAAALLSDHHGSDRGRALLEANIVASCAAVLAPLAVGALAATAAGGRAALLLPAVGLAALFLAFRGRDMHSTGSLRPSTAPPGSGRPPGYWRGCTLVAAVVAVEFCVIFFAPALLHRTVGLGTVGGATLLGLFYAGELAGRIAGSRVAGRTEPPAMIAGALTLAGVAALGLLLSPLEPLSLTLLFLIGLGVGNLYPLALALAVETAQPRTDEVVGDTQLLVGLAVAGAPLLLGAIADQAGVQVGFVLEPLLALAALGLLASLRPIARAPAG